MAKKKVVAKKKTAGKAKIAVVLQSRVKDIARGKGVRVAGDFVDAANGKVVCLIEKAVERAKANGRATLRPADL